MVVLPRRSRFVLNRSENRGRVVGFRALSIAMLLWCRAGALAGQSPASPVIDVTVFDHSSQAVPGARVQLKVGQEVVATAETDEKGRARFTRITPARYAVVATKEGFEPAQKAGLDLAPDGSLSIGLTLVPLTQRESIDVRDTAAAVEVGSSAPTQLAGQSAKELPNRPATVADALPMLPGVVREPGGGLMISAGGEQRSAMIVNSADVTDPATGQFGLTIPIDSVETLNVFQTPYLSEYGRFTAGLVSVETRRGGDKWKWELNDPLPEFRIRSYHMRGLKDTTPRLNFEGPIVPHRLYLVEGFEYEIRKTAVYTLPFPENQKLEQGINSFTQFDWIVSDKHLVTATVHAAPQHLGHVNMDYFNPLPTTPDASTHSYTGTVSDRLTLFGGLLESTFSTMRFDVGVWAEGDQDLTITPMGNRGNYFANKTRDASRYSGASIYSFASLAGWGAHSLKIGSYLAGSSDHGQLNENPVDILGSMGQWIERIDFPRSHTFQISDIEYSFYGQDHWVVTPRLALDLGVRTESQQVSGASRVAPRGGVAWSPFAHAGTLVQAGYGLFFDRVPLNVYCFNKYPDQNITMYGADGQVSSGPFLYLNTLGQVRVKHPFVFQRPQDGNFSPESAIWSLQIEQPLTPFLKLRVGYLQNYSQGLVILNSVAPDPDTNNGAYLLSGVGQSRYRQLEVTARMRLKGEGRQLFFSYVRSRARGDLNDFSNYLGTFPIPIIRGNQFGNLPADLPNRLLAWGMVQLPWKFRIAPVVEYRNGFPYFVTDAAQNYAGVPNQHRFPNFLSLDSRISKDIQVNPKYAVRLSVSSFNLTNHFNPEALHTNVADPAFGFFFGHRGRRFTADFDVLF